MEKKQGEDVEKKLPEASGATDLPREDEAILQSVRDYKAQMMDAIASRPDFLGEEALFELQPPKEGSIQVEGFSEITLDHRVTHWIAKEIEKIEQVFWEEFQNRTKAQYSIAAKYFSPSLSGRQFDLLTYLKENEAVPPEKIEEARQEWGEKMSVLREEVYISLQKDWQKLSQKVVEKLSIAAPLAEQFSDRFIPLGTIGRGGSGKVYLAWHMHLQKKVALKIVPFKKHLDRQQFSREIRNLAVFDHPHIVYIYHAGLTETEGFLAMELMQGGSLFDLIDKENPLPVFAVKGRQGAIDLMITIAETLACLHEKVPPMKHNDIKPSNILFDGERIKLADFGISNDGETDEWDLEDMEIVMSKDGEMSIETEADDEVFGTAAYMAPEKIKEQDPMDPRSDIYSLGVTFYQLLTGTLPIDDIDSRALLSKVVREEPVPIHTRRYDLHPQMADFIMSMLRKDYRSRPDAKKVAEILQRMKELWEHDPTVNLALQILDGPGTHQMKLMMEKRRMEMEQRSRRDTERVTHADT